ncbi:MAG: hypothetical protein PVJ84_22635 [Desulfobacteraceae bacterium]|jgi:hypothetical protein
MTAPIAIVTFFFIFVLVYVAVSVTLAVVGWWMARSAARAKETLRLQEIRLKIDRAKEKAFVISIVVTFFFITPFVVIYFFVMPYS